MFTILLFIGEKFLVKLTFLVIFIRSSWFCQVNIPRKYKLFNCQKIAIYIKMLYWRIVGILLNTALLISHLSVSFFRYV